MTISAVVAALAILCSAFDASAIAQEQSVPSSSALSENAQVAAPASDKTSPLAPAKKPIIVVSGPQYAGIRGLAVDASGQLYISLVANPPASKCVSRIAPSAHAASAAPILIFSNCNSVASENPSGIAVTLEGRIFLANLAQSAIRMLDMRTGDVQILPAGSKAQDVADASSNLDPYQPAGLAVDARRELFIADRGNNRVLTLTPGSKTFSYLAHVLDVNSLATDAQGSIVYAASPASHQIFRIDVASGMSTPFAGTGDAEPDGSENRVSPVPALSANIASPAGVAVDSAGNVFISDAAANALLRVDAQSGMLSLASHEELNSPGALAIDRQGDVFVADRGNHRVLEFAGLASPAATGNVTLSPASLDFGAQPTGGTTATQTLTLTNNSGAALTLNTNDLTFSGANPNDFTQTNNCAPQVASGGSCQINVAFAPQGAGARSATIQMTDSDPSSPQTAQLTGTGDTFSIVGTTTQTTANVVPGNAATYTLTLQPDNTFSGTVNILCPSVLPRGANLTCSTSPSSVGLTPGQSQQFNVKITTQGPNATTPVSFLPSSPFFPRRGPARGIGLEALAALLMLLALAFALRGRSPQSDISIGSIPSISHPNRAPRFLAAVFALASVLSVGGCYHRPSVNPNETPVGVYTLDITATSQGASRSITLTLNVE